MRRLDTALDEAGIAWRGRRVFLKLDTQGYDLEVFAGLGDVAATVTALFSEVSLIPLYQGMPHWTRSIDTYEAACFGVVELWLVTRNTLKPHPSLL